MERTLVILKPDCVWRGLIGEVIKRFEDEKFNVIALRMLHLSVEEAEKFYAVHQGREFYERLTKYMSSSPVVSMVLECEEVILRVRELIGATDPKNAVSGTIRKKYALSGLMNVVHASDSLESAREEIAFFFNEDTVFHYQRRER
ncbi:nucleoside-diphosphate kinase [Candidatus Desantisbacteria bacterium]|nr:nucleoside-diphosphate kinase [Candidatus Desantisbacteria bacterium]